MGDDLRHILTDPAFSGSDMDLRFSNPVRWHRLQKEKRIHDMMLMEKREIEYEDRVEWWDEDEERARTVVKNPDIEALRARHQIANYFVARSIWLGAADSNMPLDDFARACLSGKGTFAK